ncbi:MAG: DnaJ domain-containing protein [Rhizobiaceae bacterium]|nr:DnaJ domain-containing protein [Rhizobiaceae bacterium]MCV0405224.1 DnaJ domain-containing protein [Rhizobiaceae bacterium]
MAWLFYAFALLLALSGLGFVFLRADPARIAGTVNVVGPVILGAVGLALTLIGRAGLGGMALSGAAAWYLSARRRQSFSRTPGRSSTVRTAALEMELDHDTGGLDGVVLAGTMEGRRLADLDLETLKSLLVELGSDEDSRRLLETYLDGRFPVWRDDAEAHDGAREGSAPGSGPMTEQEAYEILGLEPGASAADIRKAHRRLMQRVHPDHGGTSFLAARINEAKDFLLAQHR